MAIGSIKNKLESHTAIISLYACFNVCHCLKFKTYFFIPFNKIDLLKVALSEADDRLHNISPHLLTPMSMLRRLPMKL